MLVASRDRESRALSLSCIDIRPEMPPTRKNGPDGGAAKRRRSLLWGAVVPFEETQNNIRAVSVVSVLPLELDLLILGLSEHEDFHPSQQSISVDRS